MKNIFLNKFVIILLFSTILTPLTARCRGIYGHRFDYGQWPMGYWSHGYYLNQTGWWWVVGENRYFYTTPVYPYPLAEAPPVVFVQNSNSSSPPFSLSAGDAEQLPQGEIVRANPPVAPAGLANGKSQAYSYYCEKLKTYFPLVSRCDSGWIATPVKPPN